MFQHFSAWCSTNLTYFIRNGNMIRHFFMIKRDLFVAQINIKQLSC